MHVEMKVRNANGRNEKTNKSLVQLHVRKIKRADCATSNSHCSFETVSQTAAQAERTTVVAVAVVVDRGAIRLGAPPCEKRQLR